MIGCPFYKQHWLHIDEERLGRYDGMFRWSEASRRLYDAAEIDDGHVVADFGCGPGHTAMEIAKWVGPTGEVIGLDINSDFIAQAKASAADSGVAERVRFYQSDGQKLPIEDALLDRITTRNTLIYVDDPQQTLSEFRRVLKPEGRVHAIEGDWGLMAVEPLRAATWQAIVRAASKACRTQDIGRKLTSLLARCGFRNISLQVVTRPDLTGRLLPMLRNMAEYSGDAVSGGSDALVRELEEAIEVGDYLCIAPQFIATAIR